MVPEVLADKQLDLFIGKAEYSENPGKFIWDRVLESGKAADAVLTFEKELLMDIPPGNFKRTFYPGNLMPVEGSAEEKTAFNKIQEGFKEQFEKIFPDKLAPRTVVIIPSFSLDEEIVSKIKGHTVYEERLLCFLMFLFVPVVHSRKVPSY